MLATIYTSGFLFAIIFLFAILLARKDLPFQDKLLLFSVSLIPLGKLIYLPIPGFYGLKVPFLVTSLVSLYWIARHKLKVNIAILFVPAIFAGMSLAWLEDPSWLFLYAYRERAGITGLTGTTESVLLRVVSFVLLLLYCSSVYSCLRQRPLNTYVFARYFIYGTLASSFVGSIFFTQVWQGNFSVEDLAPISVDSHIVGNFYRFNPGANVNEFSMILAFAMILLAFSRFSYFKTRLFLLIFVLCEFATLTRGSWIALIVAYLVGQLFNRKSSTMLVRGSALAVFLMVMLAFLYSFSPEMQQIIESRTALELGASGEERIEKFSYVFDRVVDSPFRLLFGYGWATNLYVHSVYLQVLYEIGLVGLIVFLSSIMLFLRNVINMAVGPHKAALVGVCVFIAVVAATQHNLYHTQTWLMIGFAAAVSASAVGRRYLPGIRVRTDGIVSVVART